MAARRGSRSMEPTSEASLVEQLKLLTIENERLRNIIVDKGFSEVLQAKSPNQENTVVNKRTKRGSTSAAVGSNTSPNLTVIPGTPTQGGRGCACKRNCSTKVCGCVKKNVSCGEFCRCTHELCQNLETNKENREETTSSAERHDRMKSDEEDVATSHDNEQTKSNRENLKKNNNKVEKKLKSTGATKKRNNRGSSEDADEGHEDEGHPALEPVEPESVTTKNKKKSGKKEKPIVATKNRNKRISSEDDDDASTKIDNPDSEYESDRSATPPMKEKKIVAKKGKRGAVSKKRNNPVSSEEVDKGHEDESHPALESVEPESMSTKNKKKSGKKEKPIVATKNRNNRVSSEDDDEASEKIDNPDSESESDSSESLAIKEKKIVENKEKSAAVLNKRDNRINSDDADGSFEANEHSDLELKLDDTEAPSVNQFMENSSIPQASEDFEPIFKPRRQLSRSPLSQQSKSQRPTVFDPSERLLPVPIKEEEKEEIPLPAEIQMAVVDWDEHIANLVRCDKCKRTFLPQRIEKHRASCLNI